MRWRLSIITLLLASPVFAQGTAANPFAADEALLRGSKLPVKGADLLQTIRDRTPSPDITAKFQHLAARLKTASYGERLRATAELIKMGPVVRPLLENHLLEIRLDPETTARLRHVLEQFPADKDHAIVCAAARLIARDKPADSLPALFDFIPYATNETVRQETQRAIDVAAVVDKKPAPLVLAALKDADPARSAAAAEALVRNLGPAANAEIAALLKKPHPLVRYQLGLALVEKNDKAGLPLLIHTLADGHADRVDHAVELLYRAAGENAPVNVYRGKASAAEFSAAWLKWHQKHAASLDLAKALARNELGFTIISCTGLKVNTKNKIFELGADKTTVRWEFDGPRYPLDVQVVGPNRVLMAEYFDRRVTERDFKGNILWHVNVNMPIACQRLPNGNTFIAARSSLQIVDRDGVSLFNWPGPGASISAAYRLPNGQIALVTTGGRCQLLDAEGRELKSFALGPIYTLGGNIEVLPNGRILAPLYTQNCIAEFGWDGAKHWTALINRPISVSRLPNGNTLVTCSLDYRVVELDPAGKEVWSQRTEGRPFRARRR